LLDFFVTPAVFYRFGKTAAERLAREHAEKHGERAPIQPASTTTESHSKPTVATPAGASDRGNASASASPETGRPAASDQGAQS
jgi:hypothetical protein